MIAGQSAAEAYSISGSAVNENEQTGSGSV